MRKIVSLLLTLGCILGMTASAGAAPAMNGSTGMIYNPTADVLREGQFSAGYYHWNDTRMGILDMHIANNLEMGVTGFRYNQGTDRALVSAKFALAPETILTPGLAVGVEDIANVNQRTAYVVASKALPFGFRIHAGVGNGHYDGMFAGIEKTINPVSLLTGKDAFPATTLLLEYDGKHTNYGARLSLVPGLKLDAGWRDKMFYVGTSFTR